MHKRQRVWVLVVGGALCGLLGVISRFHAPGGDGVPVPPRSSQPPIENQQPSSEANIDAGTWLRTADAANSGMGDSEKASAGEGADLFGELLRISQIPEPGERQSALRTFIQTLSDPSMASILSRLLEQEQTSRITEIRGGLVGIWAEARPAAAAAWAWGLPDKAGNRELLTPIGVAWANQDLSAAVAWLEQLPDSDARKEALVTTIAYEAARSDPLTAAKLAMQLPSSEETDRLLDHAVRQWADQDPRQAWDWASQMTDPRERQKLLASIAVEWAPKDPAQAATMAIDSLEAGRLQEDAVVSIAQRWAKQDPQRAAEWVSKFPKGTLKKTAGENVAAIWSGQDPSKANAWLKAL